MVFCINHIVIHKFEYKDSTFKCLKGRYFEAQVEDYACQRMIAGLGREATPIIPRPSKELPTY